MPEPRFNLLEDPIIGMRVGDVERLKGSLPEALHYLGRGDDVVFLGQPAYHAATWHMFLVQLAGLALTGIRQRDTARPVTDWQTALLCLTEGRVEPWCLVVEDVGQPAFMQPPVPEGTIAAWRKEIRHPEGLDILIGAKNHDLKQWRMAVPSVEDWLFALVNLQTSQGFLGAGNYGISRMNGGFASRPLMGVAPSLSTGARFVRDVDVILGARPSLLEAAYGYAADGLALLWLAPWNGDESLPLNRLDPFFIEICRRVRLVERQGQLAALAVTTKGPRVFGTHVNGNTGDIWTPVRRKDNAALTVPGDGFTYKRLQEILFGSDYARPPALEVRREDGPEPFVIAQVLVRGQGKTEGWHERRVPVSRKAAVLLRTEEGRNRLGDLARSRVATTADVAGKVLRPPILKLLQGAPDKLNMNDHRATVWLARYDALVDEVFFDRLWHDIDESAEDRTIDWQRLVLDFAKIVLDEAIETVPMPSVRRYRIVAETERFFTTLRHKHFPHALRAQAPQESQETNHVVVDRQ